MSPNSFYFSITGIDKRLVCHAEFLLNIDLLFFCKQDKV